MRFYNSIRILITITEKAVLSKKSSDHKADVGGNSNFRRTFCKYLLAISGTFGLSTLLLGSSGIRAREIVYERKKIANSKDMSKSSVKAFTYPFSDIRQQDITGPCLLIRLPSGELKAYSAVCTHLRCTVHYEGKDNQIDCSCHGGIFDPFSGAVIKMPPRKPLPEVQIEVDDVGDIYASGVTIKE